MKKGRFNKREYSGRRFSGRKFNKRKRILVAYTLRAIVVLVLAGMISLMICGCIFIYDWLCKEKEMPIWGSDGNYGRYVSDENEDWQSGGAGTVEGSNLTGVKGEIARKRGTESDGNYSGIKIVLDAGHGGSDGGTFSGDVIEEDINLSVVLRMKEFLEEKGAEVVLTRDSDETVSLSERAQTANRTDADLFVSIHCNYYEDDASINGLECYYYDGSKEGQYYAENILEQLEEGGEIETRNAKESDFYVLRNTSIPAVLIEIGYLSNAQECRMLAGVEYQELLAEELADSILKSVDSARE